MYLPNKKHKVQRNVKNREARVDIREFKDLP